MEQVLFRHNKPGRCVTFDEYLTEGGFAALRKGLTECSPDQVQQLVIDSGLRGRGGAGFPTGRKWSFVPRDLPGPRWLICNCDEMEPGTYKDRVLLEANPYALVEGMVLAAYALGVRHAFVFIRRGYETAAANLRLAIGEARQAGLLGENILGSGFSCDIDVHVSAGRYICGEETALMNSIEGKRGNPRIKPPFPAAAGLWGCPTTINNVETLAAVPHIIAKGGAWYKAMSLSNPKSTGTKLFSVCGAIAKPGNYEVTMGFPMKDLLWDLAGGPRPGRTLKAVQPGGRVVWTNNTAATHTVTSN